MCGIVGFLNFHQHVIPDPARIIRSMSNTLAHRGPDACGTWLDQDAGVALGHRRLSIIDVSDAGAQPMASTCGRYVIAYNGELYNTSELRSHLQNDGVSFCGHSDTEVLLEACASWGIETALQKSNGMFSFALWDKKERSLTLARDRLGIKPLYWCRQDNLFAFSSELKALRVHPEFRADIDRNALTAYMRFAYVPAPHTIYQNTFKLEPGHWLKVEQNGTITQGTFWALDTAACGGVLQRGTEDERLDALESLLSNAVGRQMVSDVPIGCFLSGGIDSSLVTALMQAQSGSPVRTFTIGFHDQDHNEAGDAKRIAQHLGTDHTELYVDPDMALDVIPRLPEIYDEPFGDSSQIPTWLVSQLAHQDVKVALSGDGGDEGFGGYNRYFWGDRVRNAIAKVPPALRPLIGNSLRLMPPAIWDGAARAIPAAKRPANVSNKVAKLARLLEHDGEEALYLHLVSQWNAPHDLVLGGVEPTGALNDTGLKTKLPDFISRMQYLDTLTYLPDDILTKVDRASMSVGLEVRVPLLDHRVIETAWALPHDMKVRDGEGKWALKEILGRHVPRPLFDRPKRGFGVPIADWLRGPLKEWAADLLSYDSITQQGYLNADLVQRLWTEHQSRRTSHAYALWTILMYQAWYRNQSTVT